MWNTDTLWFDAAVVLAIFAIGGIFFGHFEAHKPKWRRVLKVAVMLAIVLGLSATAGRAWAYAFLALPLLGAAYVHLRWLPRHGVNGLTGEPRDRYLELVTRKRGSRDETPPADDPSDAAWEEYNRPPPDPAAFRFDFDDVVRVVSDNPELAEINGERGVISGRGDDTTNPGYAVFIYRDGIVWCVEEDEIEATGERDPRPAPEYAVRVRVDEQGRGNAVGIRKL